MSHASPEPQPEDSERIQEPIRELTGLRRVDPPPGLVARVMTNVADPRPITLWQWLRRPFRIEIRLSPLGTLALGLVLGVGMALFIAPRPHPTSVHILSVPDGRGAGQPVESGVSGVIVRFMLEARGAKHVVVAGSFNEWNTSALELEDVNHDGIFVATVALPPGLHEYMFVVDGEWVPDPAASERRPDGFGRQNSLLRL